MVKEIYDVIVIGGGLLGASTASALAKSGRKVLVLEAHEPYHSLGSSHGHSRIMRGLNIETHVFNQTAQDSLKAMREMEQEMGPIVCDMPAIFIMDQNSVTYTILRDAMKSAGQSLEEISSAQLGKFGLKIGAHQIGLIDLSAATFNPGKILEKLYRDIKHYGSKIHFKSPVTAWRNTHDGVIISTKFYPNLRSKKIVIATGAWGPETLKNGNASEEITQCVANAMQLERVTLFYFDYPEMMPDVIPLAMLNDGNLDMYALPEVQPDGTKYLKVGFHEGHIIKEGPNAVDRTVSDKEKARATAYVEKMIGQKMMLRDTGVCLYAMTKDKELPLVGNLPTAGNVYLALYGGGICAKHAIALGNALSHVLQEKQSPYDLSAFSVSRLFH